MENTIIAIRSISEVAGTLITVLVLRCVEKLCNGAPFVTATTRDEKAPPTSQPRNIFRCDL